MENTKKITKTFDNCIFQKKREEIEIIQKIILKFLTISWKVHQTPATVTVIVTFMVSFEVPKWNGINIKKTFG